MSVAADRLALYLQAEAAILNGGQEASIDGKRVREADLEAIRAEIALLSRQVAAENRAVLGGSPTRYAVADFSGL